MKKFTLILLVLICVTPSFGQKKWQKNDLKISPAVCYAIDSVEKSFVPPSPEITRRLKSAAEAGADISVNYSLFPNEAKKAFEYAVSIWEQVISSPVKIYVQANWRSQDRNVLGSAGPTDYLTDFVGIPHENLYYPIALVEKLKQRQITGISDPDISADFNKDINWYFGIDGKTPDSLYDFVTVVLHEIGHGLGFTGFFFVNEQIGSYAYTDIGNAASFDRMVISNAGEQLIDSSVYKNPSEELRKALESGLLYVNSPVAILTSGGEKPRLYSPSKWDDGSSVYHLNDATYPPGNPNSLMTHAFGRGEAIHDPGPITRGILADVGWKSLFFDFEKLRDQENVTPVAFNVNIESDYELDLSSLYVVYSLDSFQTPGDSIKLLQTNTSGHYSAQFIPPDDATEIYYYLIATDEKKRIFTLPADAPENLYSLTFGPDSEKPKIAHNSVDYYFLVDDQLRISADVSDNIGIDTVFVEYSINGVPHDPFGLTHDSAFVYNGTFNFDSSNLNDGDKVSYRIVAMDSSSLHNVARLPADSAFSFIIERKLNVVEGYFNNFDNPSSDFILSDFDVYTANGFNNPALHSPHPYPSPEVDDSVFNFTTILKHPILLQENGTMTFDEIVLVEPGSVGTDFNDENFWDYVIVEGSNDNGKFWYPLADGYDSREVTSWENAYNQSVEEQISTATGTPDMYVKRKINLTSNPFFTAGDTILIRFRLFSDPYAHGWGWAIDNLRIQFVVAAPVTVLSPGNITVYPNPFSNNFKIDIDPSTEVRDIQLDVYNMYGQNIKSLLFKSKTGKFSEEIALPQSVKGMYLLTVKENGKQILSKKMIKN